MMNGRIILNDRGDIDAVPATTHCSRMRHCPLWWPIGDDNEVLTVDTSAISVYYCTASTGTSISSTESRKTRPASRSKTTPSKKHPYHSTGELLLQNYKTLLLLDVAEPETSVYIKPRT